MSDALDSKLMRTLDYWWMVMHGHNGWTQKWLTGVHFSVSGSMLVRVLERTGRIDLKINLFIQNKVLCDNNREIKVKDLKCILRIRTLTLATEIMLYPDSSETN